MTGLVSAAIGRAMVNKTNLGKRRAAAAVDSSPLYVEKRQAIIEAAARVFGRLGYEATTFGKIAEELATDRATIYYYASSKQDLLDEVIRQASEKNLISVEAIASSNQPARAKLRQALCELMASYDTDYPYLAVFLQHYLRVSADGDALQQESLDWARRYYAAVRSILQQGIDDGEFRLAVPTGVAAIGVIGTINWVHAASVANPRQRKALGAKRLTQPEIGAGLADMLLVGLLPRDGEPVSGIAQD